MTISINGLRHWFQNKAVVYTAYGSPDVLQLKDVEKPAPTDIQVLIKVYATTAEAADAMLRQGTKPSARLFTDLFKPKFATSKGKFAGKIEAGGRAITRFMVGDHIVALEVPVSVRKDPDEVVSIHPGDPSP